MIDSSISVVTTSVSNLERDDNYNSFTFQSIITKLDKPIGKDCPVYILNKSTGQIVYKTATDETSSVYVPNLKKFVTYLIIASDVDSIYNSTVFDLTWQFGQESGYNYSLNYYDVSNLDNIQSILDFNRPSENLQPNTDTVSFISLPLVKDDVGLLNWNYTGLPRRSNIGKIPSYVFNGASTLFQDRGFFYQKLPLTFEAYFNVGSKSTLEQFIFSQVINSTTQVSLYLDINLNLVFKRQSNIPSVSSITLSSLAPIILDKNYHVAICFDGTNFYLYLNGVLQTTLNDTHGIPYVEYQFTIGTNFIGEIGGIEISHACKYTTNFDVVLLPFSYLQKVYNNPADALANYVVLQIKNSNKTVQPFIQDVAKNISFKPKITEFKKDYFMSSAFNTTLNEYGILPLGSRDFCIELKYKVFSHTVGTGGGVMISNDKTSSSWSANSWFFSFNSSTYPNKYTLRTYDKGNWSSVYPTIFKEIVDIAIVRNKTKLQFYFNGFLDTEFTIAETLNLDSKSVSSLAFGSNLVANIYDIKITMDNPRYMSEYTPRISDIVDKDIREQQYLVANYPFKRFLIDQETTLQFINTNIALSKNESLNGTYSAYFNETAKLVGTSFYVPKETFTLECFVKPETKDTQSTIYSLYDATKEYFSLAIRNNLLSYYNGTTWVDTTYTIDYEIFNHIVVQRIKNTVKILAHGNLLSSFTLPTLPIGYLTLAVGCSKASANFFKGYMNNFYIYKNYSKFEDVYTVPVEEMVTDPNVDPVVVVNQYTTSALDFEANLVDKIPTTVWTKTGSTSSVTSTNKIFGSQSFQMKTFGDSLTLPANHINSNNPYTIDFYMLHNGYTRGSSRTDTTISIFSKNTGGDKYIALSDNRTLQWTVPHVKNGSKIPPNEITHYTYTYDGAASRLFINDKLEAIGGGSMDFINGQSLSFGHHEVSGYPNWAFGTQGIWDNFNIHQGIATVVRDKDPNADFLVVDLAFDGENNSNKIIDNGSLKIIWSNSADLRLSTAQPFDGFSSLFLNSNGGLLCETQPISNTDIATISFDVIPKRSNNNAYYDTYDGSYDGGFQLIQYNNQFGIWYSSKFESSGIALEVDKLYKITFIYNAGLCKLYVNGVLTINKVLDINFKTKFAIGAQFIYANPTYYSHAYLKNFKIYKGIEIVPESQTGKIQLDFDNNTNDKYGNSLWANNGVTFDQVNSIKGSSAKFINGSFLASGKNDVFDFKNENFSIEMDLKNTSTNNNLEVIMCSGDTTTSTTTTELQAVGLHCQTYDISNNRSRLLFAYLYNGLDYILGTDIQNNIFYNYNQTRKGNTLIQRVNDVITSASNYNLTLPINMNLRDNTIIGKCLWRGSSTNSYFNGLIDNLKVSHETSGVVDKPAVHFPFETSVTNIGYLSTIVTSSGTTITPAVMENKKCMKFAGSSTISIPYNGVFDLGLKSDFYFEIDIYINRWTSSGGDTRVYILATSDADTFGIRINETNKFLEMRVGSVNTVLSSTVFQLNKFYNIKIYRLNNIIYTSIDNGTVQETLVQQDIRTDSRTIVVGGNSTFSNTKFDGYLANLRLFVGTSTIPNTYHDKKVLDLDFKPTRKSYLFKDNTNKSVIHPINLVQRDYLDSQYCCTFNGTNQCLEIGKNELFNFGYDDFIIYIKFKMNSMTNAFNMLINGYHGGGSSNRRPYLGVGGSSRGDEFKNKLLFDISGDSPDIKLYSNNDIIVGEIYEVILQMKNQQLTLVLDNVLQSTTATTNTPINFNEDGNTIFAKNAVTNASSSDFSGVTLYDVKVLRNTTDLTLLV